MSARATRRPTFRFRLYVATGTQNSLHAVANLNALCREVLEGMCEIEIVDVLKNPDRALVDGILMTPTLVRLAPHPVRQIVGTLGQRDTVLMALGLETPAA